MKNLSFQSYHRRIEVHIAGWAFLLVLFLLLEQEDEDEYMA